jgi:2-phosphoglycerate kinase
MLAKALLKQNNLPYLSLDWLMMGFNSGIPEYGIHHLLWPNEIANKMWPFLSSILDNMIYNGMDYVVEGEAMLPELLFPLFKQYPNNVKAVFLGYTNIDVHQKMAQIKQHVNSEDDWLCNESDIYIKDHIENMRVHSRMIEKQCAKFDLPYFDTSQDLPKTLDKAIAYLLTHNAAD